MPTYSENRAKKLVTINLADDDCAIAPTLFRLGLPAALGAVLLVLAYLEDAFFLYFWDAQSHVPLGYVTPFLALLTTIMIAIATSLNALVGQALGKGNLSEVRTSFLSAFVLIGCVEVFLLVIAWVGFGPLMEAFGASDSSVASAMDYLFPFTLTFFPLGLSGVGCAGLRAMGFAKPTMVVGLGITLTNLIADPFLILGFGPIPSLGMQGAALATLLGALVGAFLTFVYLYQHGVFSLIGLRKRFCEIGDLIPEFCRELQKILNLSVWVLGSLLIDALLPSLMFLFIKNNNAMAVALGLGFRLHWVIRAPLLGIGTGATSIISQCWGSGNYLRIQRVLKQSLGLFLAWSGFCFVASLFLAMPISISLTPDFPHAAEYLGFFLLVFTSCVGFETSRSLFTNAFQAILKVKFAAVFSLLFLVCILLPAIALGKFLAGNEGILVAISLANLLAFLGIVYVVFKTDLVERLQKLSLS
ncbi:MAG: MATE family efflux transporter [Myxococcota bacterium]|nr:MATE family efflux transporter [Myxococcota bacterium]